MTPIHLFAVVCSILLLSDPTPDVVRNLTDFSVDLPRLLDHYGLDSSREGKANLYQRFYPEEFRFVGAISQTLNFRNALVAEKCAPMFSETEKVVKVGDDIEFGLEDKTMRVTIESGLAARNVISEGKAPLGVASPGVYGVRLLHEESQTICEGVLLCEPIGEGRLRITVHTNRLTTSSMARSIMLVQRLARPDDDLSRLRRDLGHSNAAFKKLIEQVKPADFACFGNATTLHPYPFDEHDQGMIQLFPLSPVLDTEAAHVAQPVIYQYGSMTHGLTYRSDFTRALMRRLVSDLQKSDRLGKHDGDAIMAAMDVFAIARVSVLRSDVKSVDAIVKRIESVVLRNSRVLADVVDDGTRLRVLHCRNGDKDYIVVTHVNEKAADARAVDD